MRHEVFAERNRAIAAEVQACTDTLQAIAGRYGLTRERVRQIGVAHGIRRGHVNQVTDEELADLKSQYDRGVRLAHIDSHRSPRTKAPDWSAAQDNALKAMWGRKRCADIARVLGTTKNAVIGRANRLGLPRLKEGTAHAA